MQIEKWISVDERLPNEFENVLVFDGNFIGIGYFTVKNLWAAISLTHRQRAKLYYITHWMALPDVPI